MFKQNKKLYRFMLSIEIYEYEISLNKLEEENKINIYV